MYKPGVPLVGALLLAGVTALSRDAPPAPIAHFHHVHLNSTDPQAAIDFYTSKLESEKRKFAASQDAVWAHQAWLLFTKVDAPPKSDITSAIWQDGFLSLHPGTERSRPW
jgi:hypothetical protein